MGIWVYILRSQNTGRYYCGQTNNFEKRVAQHNDPAVRLTLTTKRFVGPWDLVWSQECWDRSEGMRLERPIKKRGISRFLEEPRRMDSWK
ncbi:MAG: GIY-YIG nuclease family protein [candidate division NC10 bacterium]|nr:GIY-YIG nuclease family protein [candidate division NC10 bacterium]